MTPSWVRSWTCLAATTSIVGDRRVGLSGNMPTTIACWAKADTHEHSGLDPGLRVHRDCGRRRRLGSHFNIDSIGGPGGVGAHAWGWEETIFTDQESLEWHHYAMTYDGTTIKYYGDGLAKDTDPGKSNVVDLSIRGDRVLSASVYTAGQLLPGQRCGCSRLQLRPVSCLRSRASPGTFPRVCCRMPGQGDAVAVGALAASAAHAGGQSLKLKYNTRVVPCAGAASVTPPYKDLTRGGANAISVWVKGAPKNYTDWLFVAVADTGGAMFLATYKDMSGLSSGEWANWVVPLQLFSANGVKTTSAAKVGVGALAGRPGPGTFYVDDIRLIKK